MKLLCVHGYNQNAEIMKQCLENFIYKLLVPRFKVFVQLDYIESPIKCNNNTKKWWTQNKDNFENIEYDTIQDSLNFLEKKWNENDYDGIIGFSQGSVLVEMFCLLIETLKIKTIKKPKILILFSPYLLSLKYDISAKIDCFVILIIGSKDTLISLEKSIQVKKYFKMCKILLHSGGHFIPSAKSCFYNLLNCLEKYITA